MGVYCVSLPSAALLSVTEIACYQPGNLSGSCWGQHRAKTNPSSCCEWIRCTASRCLQANAHFLFPVLKTHQESCRYVFYDGHCLNTEGKLGSQENRANVTTDFIDIYEFIIRKCLNLSSQLINEPVAVIVPPNTRTLSSLTLFIPPNK